MTDIAPAPITVARGARHREGWRMTLVVAAFLVAYGAVALKMGLTALAVPTEPQIARGPAEVPVRGEIMDADGALLAGNLPGWSLYANPKVISDPEVVAIGLSQILDVDAVALAESLSRDTRFAWVKRPITPRQRQAVLEMGEPGLAFGAREVRVYPAGRLAAHILGGTSTIAEGVAGAELAGSAGIEHFANARLSDPSRAGEPLRLSLKSAVQLVMQDVLALGMERFGAKGASAILMRVETGEIVAMASLPDFDPNQRPPKYDGPDELNPRFNRAAKGIYEFGSVMKVFTAAIALEEGRVEPDTIIDTVTPVSVKGGTFRDKRPRPDQTVEDIIVRSSNVGAIRLARGVGTERFRGYLGRLGLFERTRLELPEARAARPALPPDWTELTTVTASFGHGFSISQVHLAAAYA
ncbi:MAG: penicillin-binding transpeptidase domain-containing protein, partial [Pseudomonadota bacterium]